MDSKASAEVNAQFHFLPVKSQVFLVATLIVVCGALILAYLSRKEGISWAFLAFATLAMGASVVAWRSGQRDVDLDQGHPTTLSLENGTQLTTDSRVLSKPEGMLAITQLLDQTLRLRPLPEPSGMVNEKFVPIEGSEAAALAHVSSVNTEAQAMTDAVLTKFGFGEHATEGIQGPGDSDKVPVPALELPLRSSSGVSP